MPSVSVCIPTYNRAAILADRLERMAGMQAAFDIEICISDNASDSDTEAAIAPYRSRFAGFRYVRQPKLVSPTFNFYAAMRLATGDFIVQLGDDDCIDTQGIARCLELFAAEPQLNYIAGNCELYFFEQEQSNGIVRFIHAEERYDSTQLREVFEKYYFLEYMIMRRAPVHRYYHNEGLSYPTGWKLIRCCLEDGHIRFIPDTIVRKGDSPDQLGHRNYLITMQDYTRNDPEHYAALCADSLSEEDYSAVQQTALMRSVRYSSDATVSAQQHAEALISWHHTMKAAVYDHDTQYYPLLPPQERIHARLNAWIAQLLRSLPDTQQVEIENAPGLQPILPLLQAACPALTVNIKPASSLLVRQGVLTISAAFNAAFHTAALAIRGYPYIAIEDLMPDMLDYTLPQEETSTLLR